MLTDDGRPTALVRLPVPAMPNCEPVMFRLATRAPPAMAPSMKTLAPAGLLSNGSGPDGPPMLLGPQQTELRNAALPMPMSD